VKLAEAHERVLRRIEEAAARSGRDASEIKVIAVTKTFPADVIEAAIQAGITAVGENRAQELAHKFAVVGPRVDWHFIGPLQSNKVRLVVGSASTVHSLDRLALATEIDRRARSLGIVQDVLVQVNIAGEATKHGIDPARAVSLAVEAAAFEGLRVRGLMTIPPIPAAAEDSRAHFAALSSLREKLLVELPQATELSMGMTVDYEVAVEEGATMVRVGEAIFGPRG
jgi:PLP dependent protein